MSPPDDFLWFLADAQWVLNHMGYGDSYGYGYGYGFGYGYGGSGYGESGDGAGVGNSRGDSHGSGGWLYG